MIDRALSRKEEAKFLKAAQRVLLQGGFPNPDRTACPDKAVLKAIASREVSAEKVMDCIEHIGMCSPCYKEYDALRRQIVKRRRILLGAIAACILTGLSFAVWTTNKFVESRRNPRSDMGRLEDRSP